MLSQEEIEQKLTAAKQEVTSAEKEVTTAKQKVTAALIAELPVLDHDIISRGH